jgi:Fic family protein
MEHLDPTKPFNDLPLLPPSATVETHPVLKSCIEARSALAALKQIGALIPNQSVLINTIPLREAQSSSEIENIVTTADNLFRYSSLNDAGADMPTQETLRYRTALYESSKKIKRRPLSTRTAIEVCQIIKGVKLDIRDTPGTALLNRATGQVIYTPPEGQTHIRNLLANWEAFLHNHQELDPLVRMAIGHYQFEAIHPFADGNGRTGRLLNILFLIDAGLLEIPVLYLSRHIIATKNEYYDLLQNVTSQGQWEPWILYMLNAIENTARWTSAKIKGIQELMDHTTDFIQSTERQIYSRELTELIFRQPCCRISDLVQQGIAKRVTASKYLHTLRDIGVLDKVTIGREHLFVHTKFLGVLMTDENTFPPYPVDR